MSANADPHLDIQVAHCVDGIPTEAWEGLSPGAPFQSQRWYRFGEAVIAGCQPVYLTVLSDDYPAARAALWLVRDEPLPVGSLPIRELARTYLRRRPLMICRSPLSSMTGLVLPPQPPSTTGLETHRVPFAQPSRGGERKTATRTVVAAALEQARAAGASFLVFDFLTPDFRDLGGCGLALGEVSGPGTVLDLPWRSFDEFLAGLSRNGRKHYRRTMRHAEALGITVTRHRRVERIPEALALIRNMEQRFGSAPNPWMAGMMEKMELVDGTWLAATIGDRLVGCELALQDNGAQLVTALGLADDVPYAYFALGYEDISLAIETGARSLYWGSGAYDVKERLGFRVYRNNLVAFAGLGAAPRLVARIARAAF